jgi:hypothetical protein
MTVITSMTWEITEDITDISPIIMVMYPFIPPQPQVRSIMGKSVGDPGRNLRFELSISDRSQMDKAHLSTK